MNGAVTPTDWAAPWLHDWANAGRVVEQAVLQGAGLADALNQVNASRPFDEEPAPVRFVGHDELSAGTVYEDFVFRQRCVPVRSGLHDLFKGLCWMRFPRSTARLNAIHVGQIASLGAHAPRGPARDAATLLDENGALLAAPPALWQALRSHDWQRLFRDLRPLWGQTRLVLFGHALLEKLVTPRKPITAHVYPLDAALADPHCSLAQIDAWLAADLDAERLKSKPFSPLPVLGVPGWWPDNEKPDFYADRHVFRPPPQIRSSHVP